MSAKRYTRRKISNPTFEKIKVDNRARGELLYERLFGGAAPEDNLLMWAKIGFRLAEREPEFHNPAGRPTGARDKARRATKIQRAKFPSMSKEARRQRGYRAKKKQQV
jgi:hypothetical protein